MVLSGPTSNYRATGRKLRRAGCLHPPIYPPAVHPSICIELKHKTIELHVAELEGLIFTNEETEAQKTLADLPHRASVIQLGQDWKSLPCGLGNCLFVMLTFILMFFQKSVEGRKCDLLHPTQAWAVCTCVSARVHACTCLFVCTLYIWLHFYSCEHVCVRCVHICGQWCVHGDRYMFDTCRCA